MECDIVMENLDMANGWNSCFPVSGWRSYRSVPSWQLCKINFPLPWKMEQGDSWGNSVLLFTKDKTQVFETQPWFIISLTAVFSICSLTCCLYGKKRKWYDGPALSSAWVFWSAADSSLPSMPDFLGLQIRSVHSLAGLSDAKILWCPLKTCN